MRNVRYMISTAHMIAMIAYFQYTTVFLFLLVSRNQNYYFLFPPGGENVNKVTNIFC